MRNYTNNPYVNLGSSTGDLLRSFIDTDATQAAGYLSGTKAMADIESTQLGNAKAADELARGRKADDVDRWDILRSMGAPEEAITMFKEGNVDPEWMAQNAQAMQMGQNKTMGAAGLDPIHGTSPGQSGDVSTANNIMELFQTTTAPGQGVNDFATQQAASQGKFPPEHMIKGWGDDSSDNAIMSRLSKGDYPIYQAARNRGATQVQAMAELANHKLGDRMNIRELTKLISTMNPMMVLETLNKSPEELGAVLKQASKGFQSGYGGGNTNPRGNVQQGAPTMRWNPATGRVERIK